MISPLYNGRWFYWLIKQGYQTKNTYHHMHRTNSITLIKLENRPVNQVWTIQRHGQCWAQNTEQIQRTNKPTEERKIQRDDTQNSQKKPDVNPGARER
jgi:hypothetical protein